MVIGLPLDGGARFISLCNPFVEKCQPTNIVTEILKDVKGNQGQLLNRLVSSGKLSYPRPVAGIVLPFNFYVSQDL